MEIIAREREKSYKCGGMNYPIDTASHPAIPFFAPFTGIALIHVPGNKWQ